MRVRITATGALALASCSSLPRPSEHAAPIARGPLEARIEHPLALTQLSLGPRRARTQAEGTWGVAGELAYTSLFENQVDARQAVLLDAEYAHARLRLRHGLTHALDLEVGLAALFASGGFLDAFISDWHAFFGLPNGNRDSRPDDQFDVRIEQDGSTLYALEGHEVGLLDMPWIATWQVLPESETAPAVALRAGLELPTGDESLGFGNGALDLGVGVVVERNLGRWTLQGAGEFDLIGRSDRLRAAGLDGSDSWALGGGAEYRWNDRLSLLAQLRLQAPLLTEVELKQIDHPILDLGLGAAWDTGKRSRWSASFHEDLLSESGPDFGLRVGFSTGW